MAHMSMSCAEVEPLLPLVADGSVDPDSDPGLFSHLASCASCQQRVAEYDLVTIALERGAGHTPAAPTNNNVLRLWLPVAAAACLAIASAVVWYPSHAAVDRPITNTPIATPIKPHVAPATPVVITTTPEVLRMTRADGSRYYLVHRDGTWQPIDPETVDGSAINRHSSSEGTPVKY